MAGVRTRDDRIVRRRGEVGGRESRPVLSRRNGRDKHVLAHQRRERLDRGAVLAPDGARGRIEVVGCEERVQRAILGDALGRRPVVRERPGDAARWPGLRCRDRRVVPFVSALERRGSAHPDRGALVVAAQDDVDHAANGVGAVQRRSAVELYLHPFDQFHRDARDVGVAAEEARRAHAFAVHEDQRAAFPDAPQIDRGRAEDVLGAVELLFVEREAQPRAAAEFRATAEVLRQPGQRPLQVRLARLEQGFRVQDDDRARNLRSRQADAGARDHDGFDVLVPLADRFRVLRVVLRLGGRTGAGDRQEGRGDGGADAPQNRLLPRLRATGQLRQRTRHDDRIPLHAVFQTGVRQDAAERIDHRELAPQTRRPDADGVVVDHHRQVGLFAQQDQRIRQILRRDVEPNLARRAYPHRRIIRLVVHVPPVPGCVVVGVADRCRPAFLRYAFVGPPRAPTCPGVPSIRPTTLCRTFTLKRWKPSFGSPNRDSVVRSRSG